jgi:glutamate-1-semialdehyde 2,1-aminomutase
VFHAGTYNTNPVVMAAGLATFREVLTPENYAHVNRLSERIVAGYREIIQSSGLTAYAEGVCSNGALLLYGERIRNHRDWAQVDTELWMHYWFAMVNRGVLPQPYWWDEQWTISVAHTDADIERHLEAFAEVAPGLAGAQQEKMATAAH